jgi:hypothetical protein
MVGRYRPLFLEKSGAKNRAAFYPFLRNYFYFQFTTMKAISSHPVRAAFIA